MSPFGGIIRFRRAFALLLNLVACVMLVNTGVTPVTGSGVVVASVTSRYLWLLQVEFTCLIGLLDSARHNANVGSLVTTSIFECYGSIGQLCCRNTLVLRLLLGGWHPILTKVSLYGTLRSCSTVLDTAPTGALLLSELANTT